MRCRDLMTSEVESFREHDRVLVIARRMGEVSIGFVPICGSDGHPVGTLTDRDLALRVCGTDRLASKTTAGEVMTREPISCREDDDLEVAERLMAQHHVARMMVVDEHGHLSGVISLSDILEREDDRRAADTARRIAGREVRP